ncbi:MAG: hypothetical protein IJK78_02080 [Bacteroidales bacterium]|nr:hypothetical protein [Bacteroidales bacterium]
MKTLQLIRITLLAFLTIGFASCNKDNNGNNTNDEIIEYQGEYPAPENIEYAEDGVTYEIEAIPGQIILSADVDHNTVVNAVNANGGKIIQQYPQYGDYLVEVAIGSENAFLTAMNKLNITADLNIVEYPKEKYDYFVFDDFIDVNGIQHGKKVSSILSDCQNGSVINEINLYTSRIPNWVPMFGGVALNLCRFKFGNLLSQNQVLVNWSNGYGNNDDDWQSMTEEQKQNFTKGWKMSVKLILDKIIWLKRMSPSIDIVFAQAAGNEKCPEMAQMINDLKSNPKYKTILEENMIFVSDYSAFANTSTEYGDFCYIKEHPYFASGPNGGSTSFAAPQALCYINQVIKGTIGEDGKNITAVQALAAVKAAIRQNSNGELDLDEALEMARIMYSPATGYFAGTLFDNVQFTMGVGSKTISRTWTERVGEGYNYFTSTYSSFHNETNTNTTTNSLDMGVFNSFYFGNCNLSCYDDYLNFTNDSVDFGRNKCKKGFEHNYLDFDPYPHNYVDERRVIFPCKLPDPYDLDELNGVFIITWYFEQNNIFCIKEEFVFNWSFETNLITHSWGTHHKKIERLNKFIIDKSSNKCTFEMTETRVLTTPSYSSQTVGTLSETITEHWTIDGTWNKWGKTE